MSHIFERFGFIPESTKPVVVEFSVLQGLGGCLCPSTNKEVCIPTPSLALLNVPEVSASVSEVTTLQIVLCVVRIGPLRLGVGL